jgi:salicylate hydroxylase
MTNPVVIAGGGIGGLGAALAFAKKGIPSVVLEQAAEFAEIGAGIQVGPNGFRMLEKLGVRDAVAELAVFPDDLIVMDGVSAEEITRIPVKGAFQDRFKQPYTLVHRADIHNVLLDACRNDPLVELKTGVKLEQFTDAGDVVTIETAEAGQLHAAALVGADGIWSNVRQSVVGDGAPRVSGHIAYRAVLPIEDVEERFRKNAMILWAGPRNHLVQYPLRGGKLFNLVAVFHSDRYVEGWDRQGDPEELEARFSGNCEVVKNLLQKVNTWRMWVLCDRDPVSNWNKGRVALLGDAAHPMLQYLAQGACMALEDGITMAHFLGARPEDPASAFAQYTKARYLRAGRAQIMARVYGGFYHAEGVTRELATAFLQSRDTQQSFESLSWLYDFDPPF